MSSPETSRRAQRVARRERRRRQRLLLAGLGSALAIVIGIAIAGSLGGDDPPHTIDVSMVDYGFEGDLTAPAGELRISARNDGEVEHNIGVRFGPISGHVRPGDSVTLDLGEVPPGTYELYCDISGHEEQGMVAELVVTEPVEP